MGREMGRDCERYSKKRYSIVGNEKVVVQVGRRGGEEIGWKRCTSYRW